MKPVNGQIIDDISKLDNLEDMKGKKLKFKQDDEVGGDLCYTAKGSDGKTYSAQLEKRTLKVSLYDTPDSKEKVEKKAIEERGEKLVQGGKVSGGLEDAKDNEGIKEPQKESNKKDLNTLLSKNKK
jgi:hypothetical protein